MNEDNAEQLLGTEEVARILNTSSRKINRLIKRGLLPAIRVGARTYAIKAQDVQDYQDKKNMEVSDMHNAKNDTQADPHVYTLDEMIAFYNEARSQLPAETDPHVYTLEEIKAFLKEHRKD